MLTYRALAIDGHADRNKKLNKIEMALLGGKMNETVSIFLQT